LVRLTVFGSNSLHNPVLKGYRLSGWQRQLDPGGILLSTKKLGMACDRVAKTAGSMSASVRKLLPAPGSQFSRFSLV
jgi:hypothetical protein